MPLITQFNIDQSSVPGSVTKREYSISGDVGSEFILQVVSSENKYYNFTSNTVPSPWKLNSAVDIGAFGSPFI